MTRQLGSWIGIILFLILVIYIIFLTWAYIEQRWIFAPYRTPPLKNGFQPNGAVATDLTPAEQEARRLKLLGPQAS